MPLDRLPFDLPLDRWATPQLLTGFRHYADVWVAELRSLPAGSEVIHFAYRLDDTPVASDMSALDLLIEAADRHDVSVVLSPHGAYHFNASAYRRLQRNKVKVYWAPARVLGSMHVKATAFVAGATCLAMLGSADFWAPRSDSDSVRINSYESGIAIRGPAGETVVQALRQMMLSTYARRRVRPWKEVTSNEAGPRITSSEEIEVVVSGFPPPPEGIEEVFARYIDRAKEEVFIEDQYFALAHPRGWRSTVMDALVAAIGRRVQVRVVLPSLSWSRGRRSFMGRATDATVSLLRAVPGASTYLDVSTRMSSGGAVVHAHSKLMIVDRTRVLTGSANLSRRSFQYDAEILVGYEDASGATYAKSAGSLDISIDARSEYVLHPLPDPRREARPIVDTLLRHFVDPSPRLMTLRRGQGA